MLAVKEDTITTKDSKADNLKDLNKTMDIIAIVGTILLGSLLIQTLRIPF